MSTRRDLASTRTTEPSPLPSRAVPASPRLPGIVFTTVMPWENLLGPARMNRPLRAFTSSRSPDWVPHRTTESVLSTSTDRMMRRREPSTQSVAASWREDTTPNPHTATQGQEHDGAGARAHTHTHTHPCPYMQHPATMQVGAGATNFRERKGGGREHAKPGRLCTVRYSPVGSPHPAPTAAGCSCPQ